MATKKEKEQGKAESIEHLRQILKPGDTVFTKLEHISRSGMMRHISCYVPAVEKSRDGERLTINDISGYVADAIGYNHTDEWHIKVNGCGFDAAFDVVYALGRALFPSGGPAKDSGRRGAARAGMASGCDEKHEENGGYLLRQERL